MPSIASIPLRRAGPVNWETEKAQSPRPWPILPGSHDYMQLSIPTPRGAESFSEACGAAILWAGRARTEALNLLTRPEGTLSPSEGERDRVRDMSAELRFLGRSAGTFAAAVLNCKAVRSASTRSEERRVGKESRSRW